MNRYIRTLVCIFISLCIPTVYLFAQSTSWTGATSTSWSTATNWTSGVPTSTTDAVLGDGSFLGINQPTVNATASCKSLTVGSSVSTTLTLTKNLSVAGAITINSNGTITHPASTLSLSGNWNNNGTYTTTSTSATVIFSGTTQSLGGTVQTIFRKLTINAGSVLTLTSNVSCTGASSLLSVSGTLNPNESPSYLTTADNVTINSAGVLKVNADVFTNNYAISTAFVLSSGSIVEYSATTINQTISSSYTYSTLRTSGASTTKTLAADLPALRSTSSSVGNLYVLSGTLDLAGYNASRGTTVAGGTLSVSNGAFLRIGGAGTFPLNYNTPTLSLSSTTEYYGNDQSVAAKTYGNLILSSTSGAVTKTMPATAFTVAGSFTSTQGAGTSVSYTAASNISVTGSINIGAATTFNGGNFSHGITGNWNNNGTFTPATSTITLKGANTLISGNAVQNFNNLSVTGSNVTAPGITDINLSGNLATSGSGTLTQNAPANLTMTGTTKTITGAGITLDNLLISGVVTTSSSITLTGNISVTGSLIASAGIVTMSGTGMSIVNTGTLTFKGLLTSGSVTTSSAFTISSSLNCSGTFTATAGTITFSSASLLSGTVGLYNVTINGTSLSLSANAVLGIAGSFVITAGSFNVTSYIPNTVNYNGAGAQTIKGTAYNNLVLSNTGTKTAGAAITVNNTLTISPSVTFDAVTFTHTMAGNWVNNGAFTAGSSTIQFTGATNTTISGVSTFNNITVNKSLTTYSVSLLNNISVATINMTLGSLYTDASTLTITTTRTGNGIILGTITRTHAFAAATAYAFEGPNNLVTFAAGVAGVTTVTINVTVAPVGDFPFNGAIGRTYTITIPSGTYTATLRLHYEDGELNGNNESVMQLWKHNGASWALSGKTSNSTTSNYVEKTLLTNITGRWTMTDDGSVLNWNGSVSSDWSVAGNWTLVQGTFSGAPGSTDIAQVGIVPFTNQPVITTAANVKNIILGSAQSATITLNAGGSLTSSGSISGVWTSDATHTINVNAQTLTVNGDLSLSDNTTNHAINLNISTGTVSVLGTVTQSGFAAINFTGAGTLNIGKDFNYSNGTFSPSTGLVKYNGTLSQVVAAVPYYNVTVIKTAGTIASLNSPTSLGGSLVVTTGELDITNTLTIAGSVTISAGAILDANGALINVGGSWSKAATGTFNAGTGTVTFNGTGTQTLSAGAFNILNFNKSAGTAVLSGNNTANGNLSLLAGTLNLSTFTLNQSSAGDVFTITDGSTLQVSGSGNFPSNFTTYAIGVNSLVQYNGTVAQTIADVPYGNITFSGGGALEKTFAGSSTINGNLIINSGASVNGGNYIITLNGNWTNSGGTFNAGTGDILLNGTTKTITGNTTFYDVTVNGSYSVASSDLTFNGHFQVTSAGSYAAGSGIATVNGDFTNSGSVSSSGTTTFSGTVLQTIRLLNALQSTSTGVVNFNGNVSPVLNSTSTPTFATLNINNTAGINPSVNWVVLVAFNVSNGAIFNGGVSTHTFSRSFTNNGTVTSTGALNFNPATAVTLQLAGTTFSSTGTVILGGSGAITIVGTPTSLQDVVIANTNAAGITPVSGWTINGKFSIRSNAIFNAGSYSYTVGGNMESDGTLNGGTSTFAMSSANGELSASSATIFNHLTVAGTLTPQTDFRVAGDFTNNGVYDGSIGVLIMTGNSAASIGGTTIPCPLAQLTIDKTGATVTQNVNINSVLYLNISSGTLFTSNKTIIQDGAGGILLINSAATLKLGGTNSLPGFSGLGLDINSNVDYAGTTQNVGNAADYGNLIISAAGNKNALVAVVVRGNLSISAGTLATSTATVMHTIGGNFTMTGGALTGTSSTYLLNGTTNQTLSALSNFINLTVNKPSGQVVLGSNITVNLLLNMSAGNVSLGSYNLTMGTTGSIISYSASKYIIASGSGSLSQQVNNGGNKIYPVGSATNYLPATVALTSGSTADNISVRVFGGVYGGGTTGGAYTNAVVNNSWMITEATPGGSDATITLQWPASLELTGFTRAACRMGHHTTGWDIGSSDIAAAGSNPYTLTKSGFTSFSVFAPGSVEALPVTWLEMYGEQGNGSNTVFWGTANESNNLLFVVEASVNGKDFNEIGRVNGQVNAGTANHYRFVHENLKSNIYYYRIRQVDIDGKFSFSKIIMMTRADNGLTVSRIYPVPAVSQVTAEIISASPKIVTVTINSLNGKLMKTAQTKLMGGMNPVVLDIAGFAPGVYVLKIKDGEHTLYTYQLVKL